VHVFERPESGTVIVARIHHAIADGFALLRVLLALCDGATGADGAREETRGSSAVARSAMARLGERLAQPGRVLGDVGFAARALRSLARLVLLPPDHRSRLRGPLGSQKRVAWTRPLALTAIKAAGRREGATVNDVVMAALAGGLRRYLLRGGVRVRDVRAMIPVNLRPPDGPVRLGNRFGLVVLALPLEIAAPRPRLRELKRRMDALKRSAEAVVGMAIVSAMGLAPHGLESWGVRFFSTKASAVLTNVPGPRTPLRLGGHTLSRMLFWVPQSGGLSIFSYVDTVSIGVMADAIRVPDPERLVADIEEGLTEILAS
jgi:WS/DGAT/MGAT family acyltransferase